MFYHVNVNKMFYTRSISVFWVLFLACTVLRYPKDAKVGCVRPIGSYWTRLEFPRNETIRENFICRDASVRISKSPSTKICIWDKRVSLTEKMPLLYCTRIASFYLRYAYTVITKECRAPYSSDRRTSRDTSALVLIIPAPTPHFTFLFGEI